VFGHGIYGVKNVFKPLELRKAEEPNGGDINPEHPVQKPSESAPPREGIYEFPDQTADGTTYVGQSENIPQRLATHEANGRLTAGTETTTSVPGGKTTREIAEHTRIQELTGGKPARESDAVANQRDPIGPNRQHLLPKKDNTQ
jgi:hypothetical protein